MGLLTNVPSQVAPLLAGLLCIFLARKVAAYVKLRRFKGPPGSGLSNWPHSKALLGTSCHEWYAQVSERYGPIARVAPRILITSSADVWSHVNKHPGYKRSDWYYHAARIEYRRDNVFTQTDNAKHERRRKQMMPGYSGRENLDLEPSIEQHVEKFLNLIRTKYVSTGEKVIPMDMATRVQFFTLDVISSVGLGKSFGMLDSDTDVDDYLRSSEEGLAIGATALAMGFSWIAQAPVLGRFVAPSPADNTGFGKMMAACFRYVDERARNPTDKRSDMLASFIRHGLAGDELRSEALEQIIAGSDTTAGAIRGTLLHVMTNPRVYAKLQREVDDAVAAGLAPPPGHGLVPHASTRQMPYLQAVIREALRVWPPVVNIFSRDLPPGGDEIEVDGRVVRVPGGVCIGYSAYAMHRSEEVYGADAKAFRPERWFEPDADRLAEMTRVNDLIFGHGKYLCLGKPVAQIEISKMVFELMRNFDMALIHPTRPWNVRNLLGLFAISEMWVQVTERAH